MEKKVKNVCLVMDCGKCKDGEWKLEDLKKIINTRDEIEKNTDNWNVLTVVNWTEAFPIREKEKDEVQPKLDELMNRWRISAEGMESIFQSIWGMTMCDLVLLAEDWRQSSSCRIQKYVADELGMDVMEWYDGSAHYMTDDE